MAFEEKQIAKELTLAAIPHLRLALSAQSTKEENNAFAAEQISKTFETILKSVHNAQR
jgi:hypothetical protein